jgi:hypothetical protein
MTDFLSIMASLQYGEKLYRKDEQWLDFFGYIQLDDEKYIVDGTNDVYVGNFEGEWFVLEEENDCEFELVHDPNDYEYTPEEAEMLGLVWDPILKMYI